MEDYLNTKGRIFDIQKFSVHDGPGIRTIVFMKGCTMRCKWCCNPESQNYKIEKMTVNGKEKIIGEDVTVGEVMETVMQDLPYYRRSGGGITLSGGECLCQKDFARDILKASKQNGINTAIESMANVPYENIEEVLPYLDYYLMDIKNMNSQKHERFCGMPNELILRNAKRVAEVSSVSLTVRVPVIPTFNDTEEEIAEIAKFAKSLKTVKAIHLLPYHRLGQDKYKGLNREYELEGILPPDKDKMEKLLKVAAETSGLNCRIGG